ncbi:hypothetical protein FQ009_23235, partial [Escherichia coli]|nr:hypothetical protein [Escherichia coli]
PSISDGRLSYQFSSDGYIRRSVYAYQYGWISVRIARYLFPPGLHQSQYRQDGQCLPSVGG